MFLLHFLKLHILCLLFLTTSSISKMRFHWNPANPRPIIGIVSESVPAVLKQGQYPWAQSALFQSYVTFIEMGGARVVPVFIARDNDFYTHKVNTLNGLVVSGEDITMANSDYVKAVNNLLDLAKQTNDNKDFFPVLAINAGFTAMANWLTKSNVGTKCSSRDTALPLDMTSDYTKSQLFDQLPDDVNESLITGNVTYNDHETCLSLQKVNESLAKQIHVLSTNKDANGMEFVSTYETLKYPFFGLQWHPERNPFEWSPQEPHIPHTIEAIRVSQYIANFFVSQARKSSHHFSNPQEEQLAVIPHYHLYYITNADTELRVLYLFRNNTK